MRAAFTLRIRTEYPIDRQVLAAYIAQAVAGWNGSFQPGDELRSISRVEVVDKTLGENTIVDDCVGVEWLEDEG